MTGEEQPGLLPEDSLAGARAQVARAQTAARSATRKPPPEPAEVDPVASVLVDVHLAHLDRTFDYSVPETMAAEAVPGARIKVRFAGQDVDGYVVARRAQSDHPGRLQPLRRVVSPEPVLLPTVQRLVGEIATRYAGSRADVLRLAVPPRHAGAEKQASPAPSVPFTRDPAAGERVWVDHEHAAAYLSHLERGESPRAVWTAAPAIDWPLLLAHAIAACLASGRGAVVCVPDHRDVARLDTALTSVLGPDQHVVLAADSGPTKRYRDFLAVSRGLRRVVIGTRAAAFAPVHDLGLVAIWDDGDDLFAEPRTPYPHAREVLLTRAVLEDTAVLLGSHSQSVEAQQLIRTGWARQLAPSRELVRERVQVAVAGASETALDRDAFARTARIPQEAHHAIRRALAGESSAGPVLVQTPRAGYAPSLACERCRTPARCRECHGPLRLHSPTQPPSCVWCGRVETAWACPECGHRGLRAPVLGDRRTAEELGRTFAPTQVISSSGDNVLATVPDKPALVVATPGAEPVAEGGYALVVLLDTWLALARADLRVGEEAMRRWFAAGALVRPGGRVLAVGDAGRPELQALVRWDPAGFAIREAQERREAHLPPAARVATITGEPDAVEQALALVEVPEPSDVLGPVPTDDEEEVRVVLRVPRRQGLDLSRALGEMQRLRSARKLAAVRVQIDPPSL